MNCNRLEVNIFPKTKHVCFGSKRHGKARNYYKVTPNSFVRLFTLIAPSKCKRSLQTYNDGVTVVYLVNLKED